MRLFLAMMSHETNTFSNVPTDRAQFEARDLRYGGEIVEAYRGTGTCLGGMIDGGRALRRDARCPRWRPPPRPPASSRATSTSTSRTRMLADLAAAGRLDGVLLDLHGAMVPEGLDDGEGDLIAAVRQRRRARGADRGDARLPRQPHARPWSRAPTSSTATRPTRTWTWPSAAWRPAERLAEVIAGRIRPTAAFRKPPLLPPLGSQGTARGPMRRLYDLADEMEKDPRSSRSRSSRASRYADIPDAGLGIYVVTDDDQALAERARRAAGARGVGAPARVHPHRAARARGGGRGARRRRPPHRARRHGRQHGRRRGGRRHRDPARAAPGGRALAPSVACLWDPARGAPRA